MPELPDLEAMREILTPRIVGRTVRGVALSRPGLLKEGQFEELVGKKLERIGRRGKYLIFSFAEGPHLLLHLMRWAWLWHGPHTYTPTGSTDLRLSFEDGGELRLIEPTPQRLASAWLVQDITAADPLRNLGPEPLSEGFTLEAFRPLVQGRRRQLKRLVVDQELIAGIGNAYADEILFQARLSPVRYAHTLNDEEIQRLWEAIPKTLRWASEEIRQKAGEKLFDKEIRDFLFVHGRAGEPCRVCATPVGEILIEGQRTNFCPSCQGVNRLPSAGKAPRA